MKANIARVTALMTVVAALLASGCQSAYYNAMEKMGRHKREILVGRVQDARDAQELAKGQFKSALEEFSSIVTVEGGDLEKKYEKMVSEYSDCEGKADDVRERIEKIEDVSKALFVEWQAELREYTSDSLRRSSQRKLGQTRERYGHMIEAMQSAERMIPPVLAAFKDQVLYLKHNLNARAIASLQDELTAVDEEIGRLVRQMESAITEADAFIAAMATE